MISDMIKNIATKQIIFKIKLWMNKKDSDKEIIKDNFINRFDLRLKTVQCHDYIYKYKSNTVYPYTTSQTNF